MSETNTDSQSSVTTKKSADTLVRPRISTPPIGRPHSPRTNQIAPYSGTSVGQIPGKTSGIQTRTDQPIREPKQTELTNKDSGNPDDQVYDLLREIQSEMKKISTL